MEFDLEPIEIPVTLTFKDKDGEKKAHKYILREQHSDAFCKSMNQMLKASKGGVGTGEGKMGEGLPDAIPLLVSMCIFKVVEGKEGGNGLTSLQAVHLQTVRQWPERVVKALHAKINEISKVAEPPTTDEDASKNEPSAMTESSE